MTGRSRQDPRASEVSSVPVDGDRQHRRRATLTEARSTPPEKNTAQVLQAITGGLLAATTIFITMHVIAAASFGISIVVAMWSMALVAIGLARMTNVLH